MSKTDILLKNPSELQFNPDIKEGTLPKKERINKRKMTREERVAMVSQKDSDKLLFSEFSKCVLDFQLREHEKFLYKFIVIFKQID